MVILEHPGSQTKGCASYFLFLVTCSHDVVHPNTTLRIQGHLWHQLNECCVWGCSRSIHNKWISNLETEQQCRHTIETYSNFIRYYFSRLLVAVILLRGPSYVHKSFTIYGTTSARNFVVIVFEHVIIWYFFTRVNVTYGVNHNFGLAVVINMIRFGIRLEKRVRIAH